MSRMNKRKFPSDKMIFAASEAYAKRFSEYLRRRSDEQLEKIADAILERQAFILIEALAEAIFAAMKERNTPSNYSTFEAIISDAENLGYPKPFSANRNIEKQRPF